MDILSEESIDANASTYKSNSTSSSSVLAATRISQQFLTDERDKERAKMARYDIEATREIEVFIPDASNPGQSAIRYKLAQPATEEFALLINSASVAFFPKNHF